MILRIETMKRKFFQATKSQRREAKQGVVSEP